MPNLEGEVLDVRLDLGITEFTTVETFSVENTVKTKVSGKIKGSFVASPINLSVSEKAT
jgi:hypothetical protein